MAAILDWSFTVGDLLWFLVRMFVHLILLWVAYRIGRTHGWMAYNVSRAGRPVQNTSREDWGALIPTLDGLPVSCIHGYHPDDCAVCRH